MGDIISMSGSLSLNSNLNDELSLETKFNLNSLKNPHSDIELLSKLNKKKNNLVKTVLISDILSQGVVLTALFPFFSTAHLKAILTETPLHYFMFPFIGFTELVLLGVSCYYFSKANNKNWQVTTRLIVDLLKVSAINTV